MNYQERVQALAEKMAKIACDKVGGWNDTNIRNSITEACLPFASESVEDTAQTIRRILFPNHSAEDINNWLKSDGLIPDEGQGVSLEYDPKGSVHNPDNPEPDQEADKQ